MTQCNTVMAVVRECSYGATLLGNDWTIYYDLGCALKFDYMLEGDFAVTVELKCGVNNKVMHKQVLRSKTGFQTYVLRLQQLDYEELCNVRELCFTVFYKDVNPENPTGGFIIKKCSLEVEG